jgi:CO/xanthine dehydrogenase Mo-binding subunit
VYTDNTYTGSLRGFGGPQAIFAIESQMEELARKLGMDPLEFRLKNMLVPGKKNATGALMDASCGLPQCVDKVVASSDYRRKAALYGKQRGPLRRGLGMALLMHGNSLGPEGNDYGAVHMDIVGWDCFSGDGVDGVRHRRDIWDDAGRFERPGGSPGPVQA